MCVYSLCVCVFARFYFVFFCQTAVTNEGICWTLGMDEALLLPRISCCCCCLPPKTAGHRLLAADPPVTGCCLVLRDMTLEKEHVRLRRPLLLPPDG